MNFCTHCGKQLIAGDSFCRYCGACVDNGADPIGNTTKRRAVSARKRGHKKVIIPLVAAIVLALGAGTVFGFPYVKNTVTKNIMSPNKYLNYVMNNQADDLSESISVFTEKLREGVNSKYKSEGYTELIIGNQFLDYIESLTGEYIEDESQIIDWVQKIKLSTTQYNDGLNMGAEADVTINDNHIANCNVDMALNDGKLYISVPEINRIGLMIDAGYSSDNLYVMNSTYNLMKHMPQKDVVKELIHDYIMTSIEAIDDVEKENTEVSIGSKSQKCTALIAKIHPDDVINIAQTVLDKAKGDEKLGGIIKDFASSMNEDSDYAYNSFIREIDKAYDELEYKSGYSNPDAEAIVTFWINAKGDIIGTSVKIDGEEIVRCLNVIDGKAFASEFIISADYEELRLEGEGTIKGTKCDGDYRLSFDNEDILSAHIEDVNALKLKDGYFEGSVTVQAGSVLIDEFGYAYNPSLLSRSQIKYESLKSNKNENKARLSLIYDNNNIISINSDNQKKDNNNTFQMPSDYIEVDDYDELEDWMERSDFNKLLDNLTNAGAPGDLVSALRDELI